MNGSAHFAPDRAPLPRWQADRLAILLDALGGIPVSDAERASLTWLCGFEADTVERIANMIERARDASVARTARNFLRDAERRLHEQLIVLCEDAGVDPGQDPHAALLAHLRGREPGGGRS